MAEIETLELWPSEVTATPQAVVMVQPEAEVAPPEPIAEPVDPVMDEILEEDAALDFTSNEALDGQMAFIDFDEWWKVEWQGMPEFVQGDLTSWKSLYVHFESREDLMEFAKLVEQPMTGETKSIWFPQKSRVMLREKRYTDAT